MWPAHPDGSVPQVPGSLRRDGLTFTGFGRASTGPDGRYAFSTFHPGSIHSPAFSAVTVFARGVLVRLLSRANLPSPDSACDPFPTSAAQERGPTLIAAPDAQGYVLDIHLQGSRETVSPGFA